MAYVGNPQAAAFSSRPPKQDLTGASGTSLTLSHAVSNAESIDLFINNVRQEPTTAYSASDTTVTLTGSVVATDDIYVIYNSLALQESVPPDGSVSDAKIATMAASKLTGSVASTAMPAGSVLQVIYAETSTSNVALTNTGWTSVGLTAQITPSSTSSKILVDFTPHFRLMSTNADPGIGFKILRGGTDIYETSTAYHTYFYNNGGYVEFRGTDRVSTLDSPSSTSQLTYTFEARAYHSGGDKRANDTGNKSKVILMEIAG